MKKNVWLDGMMGLVVGDALGVPVQFMSREEIRTRARGPVSGMEAGGVYDMPRGTWSDDSSMALATLASLRELGKIDPTDIMTRFVKWEFEGEYTPFGQAFDEGNTCSMAIYRFRRVPDYKTCGDTGERANGNGALMRILPVCLYYAEGQKLPWVRTEESSEHMADKENVSGTPTEKSQGDRMSKDAEAIEGVHTISGLTHNHLRGKMCCGFYYFMVKSILEGQKNGDVLTLKELLQRGIDAAADYYRKDVLNLTELAYLGRILNLDDFMQVPEEKIKTTGYVIDTIEAAIWCLLTTDTYKDCMLKAVNLGDDTDTVAAIAGGLAGLYYGYKEIPEEWLRDIKKREWVEEMCEI